MLEEIIKLREDGLSFRKIATHLETTVGRVQYRYNKWMIRKENEDEKEIIDLNNKLTNPSVNQTPAVFNPVKGELRAQLVSPRKIILFWEATDLPRNLIQLYFRQEFDELTSVIRIYDVTDLIFNGRNAHHFYEL